MDKLNTTCKDCGVDTFEDVRKDYYMVQHKLWKEYGVGCELLCINCFENRLGRELVFTDFLNCRLNETNKYALELKEINNGRAKKRTSNKNS